MDALLAEGSVARAAVSELYVTQGLDRVAAEEAGPGEIIAVAGTPSIVNNDNPSQGVNHRRSASVSWHFA